MYSILERAARMRLIMRFRGEEMWISWYSSRSHPGLVIFIDPSRVHIQSSAENKKRETLIHTNDVLANRKR
jgi:predicted transcriptional regulator of viral defense system